MVAWSGAWSQAPKSKKIKLHKTLLKTSVIECILKKSAIHRTLNASVSERTLNEQEVFGSRHTPHSQRERPPQSDLLQPIEVSLVILQVLLIFSFRFPSECMRFISLPFTAPIDSKTTYHTSYNGLLQFTSSAVAPSFVRNQLKYAEQSYKYYCCFCFVFLRNVRAICICKQRPHVGRDRYKGGNVSMQHTSSQVCARRRRADPPTVGHG